MSKQDFKFYMIASPLLGGFVGFMLATILAAGSPSAGIMIMIGMIAGYFPLITYILGNRFLKFDEENDKN